MQILRDTENWEHLQHRFNYIHKTKEKLLQWCQSVAQLSCAYYQKHMTI